MVEGVGLVMPSCMTHRGKKRRWGAGGMNEGGEEFRAGIGGWSMKGCAAMLNFLFMAASSFLRISYSSYSQERASPACYAMTLAEITKHHKTTSGTCAYLQRWSPRGGLCLDSNESQLVGAVHLVCRYAVNTMAHVVCVRVRTGLADLLTGRLQRPRNFRAPAHPEIPSLL